MVVVAIAGGTGVIGRSIVNALRIGRKHEILVLSHKANPEPKDDLGVQLLTVDYANITKLTDILETNKVNTVISALNMMPDAAGLLESNLVQASDRSRVTRRFIPSDFGFPQNQEDADVIPAIATKQASRRALEKCETLEWTVFYVGYLMDYFGMPEIPSALTPFVVLIDILANTAAIPGDGNRAVTFTHTSDIGKFVAASVDLGKWSRESFLIGDKMTLNEAVKLAARARGVSFTVFYDDIKKLRRGEVTELPSQATLYAFMPKQLVQAICSKFGIWIDRGDLDFEQNSSLNKEFPEIKPMKLNELLGKAWKK